MKYRIKCPKCGTVLEAQKNDFSACSKCKTPVSTEGMGIAYVYRMGNFFGSTAAFGIYIDGEPCGYAGNQEWLALPLPYGTHQVHMRVKGQPLKTVPLSFELSEQKPETCIKVHVRVGFWKNTLVLEEHSTDDVPKN